MTTPENPFAGSEIPGLPGPQHPAPEIDLGSRLVGADDTFPSWTMFDVIKVALITLGSVLFTTFIALLVASGLPGYRQSSSAQLLTDPRILVPAQMAAYAIVLFFMYRIVAGYKHLSFAEAVHWRWPHMQWPFYIIAGAVMAIALLGLERVLPMPKEMPIDQLFKNTSGAWVMAIFGVAVAPIVEELFFRGLLFPLLVKNLNLTAGILLTGFLFALIHASQLGRAWAPVLVMFIVGVLFTLVRWWAKSVAASVLMHVGYNAALFSLLYSATDGFRHLEKVVR